MTRRRPAWYLDLYFAAGVALLALAIWAFSTLVEDVLERDPLVRWDTATSAWIHARTTAGGVRFFSLLTQLGSGPVTWAIAAVGVPVLRRRPTLLTAWAAAFVGAHILAQVLKRFVQRTRPPAEISHVDHESFSFPSGHSIKAVVCYVMLAYAVARLLELDGARRIAVYVAAGALIAAIGWSRVYLGAHYPSDVFGGFAVGFAWVAVCLMGVRLVGRRAA
jgi:membrane-associated phospholipid phosphatase